MATLVCLRTRPSSFYCVSMLKTTRPWGPLVKDLADSCHIAIHSGSRIRRLSSSQPWRLHQSCPVTFAKSCYKRHRVVQLQQCVGAAVMKPMSKSVLGCLDRTCYDDLQLQLQQRRRLTRMSLKGTHLW